jgi:hypothetical protein
MGDPFKGLEKILPVHVTSENILPAVPTAHDVINRHRIFHSQLARHAGKTACSIPIASRLWFDPFSPFFQRSTDEFGVRNSVFFRFSEIRISDFESIHHRLRMQITASVSPSAVALSVMVPG